MLKKIIGVLAFAMLLFTAVVGATAADEPLRVLANAVKARMESGQKVVFIDARSSYDWGRSDKMISGAIRVGDNQELQMVMKELQKDDYIVTYCT